MVTLGIHKMASHLAGYFLIKHLIHRLETKFS